MYLHPQKIHLPHGQKETSHCGCLTVLSGCPGLLCCQIYTSQVLCFFIFSVHPEFSCLWHNLTWADVTCVSIHNMKMDYYGAFAYCSAHNGKLVTVNSAAVNRAILRNLDPNVSYYILLNAQIIVTSYCK